MSINGKAVLPLKAFIRRSQVIVAFRGLLRRVRNIDDDFVKSDIRKQIVSGFRDNINLKGDKNIVMALQEANSHLQTLQTMGRRAAASEKSWLNESTSDDQRGRVGVDWPWQK